MMVDLEPRELLVGKATQKLLHDFVLDYTQRANCFPGKMDNILYWEAGPEGEGVYIGELNGQPITGVAMIQHSDTYGFVDLYFCEEKHRGKGYAYKTWKVARAALSPEPNLALDAVPSAAPLYEKEGFKKAWSMTFHYFQVSSILSAYKDLPLPDGMKIISATQADFPKLKLYVEDVLGFTFTRSNLLEKWISLPTHIALGVVGESGKILGFGMIRELVSLDEAGYRLRPLFADTGNIARLLLLELARRVSPGQKFCTCVPSEINEEAKIMKDELQMENVVDLVRMYTKAEPPIKKEKYFACFFS